MKWLLIFALLFGGLCAAEADEESLGTKIKKVFEPSPTPTRKHRKKKATPTPSPTAERKQKNVSPTPSPTPKSKSKRNKASPTPDPTESIGRRKPRPLHRLRLNENKRTFPRLR